MSTIDRAAEVIALALADDADVSINGNYNDIMDVSEATLDGKYDLIAVARALSDAGLLAPDLPEPGRYNHRDEPIWETEGATKIMSPGMLPVSLMGPFAQGWDMYPIEARDIAYALLAAADHSEGVGIDG